MIRHLLAWLDTGETLSVAAARAVLGDALDRVLADGVAEPAGAATSLPCPNCLTGEQLRLHRRAGAWRAVCLNGGGPYHPSDEEVTLLAPRADRLAGKVGALLNQTTPKQLGGIDVWELGHAEIDGSTRALFLAVGAGDVRTMGAAVSAIDASGSQWTGGILTTGPTPSSVRTRSGHRFIPAAEVLDLSKGGLRLDVTRLARWLRSEPKARRQAKPTSQRKAVWVAAARRAWEELHAGKKLTSNLSAAVLLVRGVMLELNPPLDFTPGVKALRAELSQIHRTHYPSVRLS